MEKLEKGSWEKNWEKIQKLGLLKFSLFSGLALGLAPVVVKTLMGLTETSLSDLFLNMDFLGSAIAGFVGGFLGFGILTWHLHQYWYRKALTHIEEHNKKVEQLGETSAPKKETEKISLNTLQQKTKNKEIISLNDNKNKNRFNK